jgi:hypothetical protein
MEIYLCFYTNKKFRDREDFLKNEYTNLGFKNILPYRSEDVKTGDFYHKNKEILDCETGDGFWLWKPKILLDTFDKINYGDVIVYTDSGDLLTLTVDDIMSFSRDYDYYFTNWGGTRWAQKICTKRDCFILMDCDSKEYHDTSQMEAGFLILKKTDSMLALLNDYLKYCGIKEIIDNEQNKYGNNFENWQFHRNDQSILTNLIVKHGLNFNNSLDNKIKNNIFIP